MRVFITGDRQFTPIYPMQVTLEVIRALGKGHTVATGTNGGVEELVRSLAEATDLNIDVVEHNTLPNGKPDFLTRAQAMSMVEDIVEVVVIHVDPHTSTVAAASLAHTEDKTRLVTPADLLQ
jgi:hypothetical protein